MYSACVLVAQMCPALCNPMDCSLPGSSVHEILWTRILRQIAIPSPGDLPDPGIEPRSPTLQADSLSSEPKMKRLEFLRTGNTCAASDFSFFPPTADIANRSHYTHLLSLSNGKLLLSMAHQRHTHRL